MDWLDVWMIMLAFVACFALVQALAMIDAWFLKREFNWNPFSTRKPQTKKEHHEETVH